MHMVDVFDSLSTEEKGRMCVGGRKAIKVDLGSGSDDTAVVISVFTGASEIQEDLFIFKSEDSVGCPDDDVTGVGRFKIHFVDISDDPTAFDVSTDPSTWTYKRIPSLRIKVAQDPATISVVAYQNRGAHNNFDYDPVTFDGSNPINIPPGCVVPVGTEYHIQIADAEVGIEEIAITTTLTDNQITELLIFDQWQNFGCYPDPPLSGIVLLFDTSGSMSWDHEGNRPDDPAFSGESRLDLAKRAVIPFLVLMGDHFSGQQWGGSVHNAHLGIATFPEQGWDWPEGCNGYVVSPCTLVDAAAPATQEHSIADVRDNKIPNLDALGWTPLLAGVSTASGICGSDLRRAIVVLSDGRHNCTDVWPSEVGANDPEVDTLIQQLTEIESIKVHTIGFSLEVQEDLLTRLASDTGGEYYRIVPGDIASDGTAVTVLQETYKRILANGFQLDLITDPFRVIKSGQIINDIEVNICEHDKKVSFYLGWATAKEERLTLKVTSSDGDEVPTSGPGIRFSNGVGYAILTVGSEFLDIPGKVDSTPWRLEITPSGLEDGELEKLQYSVLVDSDLKLKTKIIAPDLVTGEDLVIQASVQEGDKLMTGLKDVEFSVQAPEESMGNWFAGAKISQKDLKGVDLRRGVDPLSLLQRKVRYMVKTLKIKYPGTIRTDPIQLLEDRRHVDKKVKSGIYTSSFSSTLKEGTYSFHFKVSGTTARGIKFTREAKINRYLRATFSPEHSDIKLIPVSITKGLQKTIVVLTPRDKYGNHLGPGYGSAIQLAPSNGQLVGAINDDLSGSYSQIIEVPASVAPDTRLKVRFGKTETSVAMEPSPTGLRRICNWFTWLLMVIIAILIIYIVYLGMQP